MTTHQDKLSSIVEQVKKLISLKQPIKISKAVDSHFVPNPYDTRSKLPKVDLSQMTEVLQIDQANLTCTAESGVTFSDLVRETLKHGLIPYTVPELKGITIGGAVSGCSIESMSYKYGGFHDSCIEYEVITGTGDVLTCTPENNHDLFNMIHGSYGTLGLLTKLKFKLLPAKPFVKMEYRKHSDFSSFWRDLKERCTADDYDFVDGIIHSPKEFIVCLGKMVEKAPYLSSYEWMKIFYKSTQKKAEDFMTIDQYFFRYDTECHWLTKTVPLMETKPARLLLGKTLLGSTNLIKWSNRVKQIMKLKRRPEVVVDVFIPSNKFEEFFRWYETDFDFFPLWIVPYKAPKMYPWIDEKYANAMDGEMFIDCAVYGKPNSDPKIDYSELLEKKTIELNGIKTLISRNHFDPETFWRVYSRNNYEKAKSQTDPHNLFMNLYDKFAPKNY
ncbi:MAG: FAD-binding protein [Deltaproteobacteria bacterium]|jgi:FAD/FMN-containing dehydrogenase|nr:FAD-binding protein [Deltaproteobacteria bacterium]